jgi:hypothetical protein
MRKKVRWQAQFDLHQCSVARPFVQTTPFQLVEARVRHPDKKIPTTLRAQVPHDWARLIRKLRWIGLKEEAKRLEMALSTVPAEQRTAPAGQGHQRS